MVRYFNFELSLKFGVPSSKFVKVIRSINVMRIMKTFVELNANLSKILNTC